MSKAKLPAQEPNKIRHYLETCFSLDELRSLALESGINHEALPHVTIIKFVREILSHIVRTEQLTALIKAAIALHPDSTEEIEPIYQRLLQAVLVTDNNQDKEYFDVATSYLEGSAKGLGHYGQTLLKYRAVGDSMAEANTLTKMGWVYEDLGDKAKALAYFNQALPIYQAVEDYRSEASTLNNMGRVYESLGDKAKALEYYEQALPLRGEVEDLGGEVGTSFNIARIYYRLDRLEKAVEYLERCVVLEKQIQGPELASDQALLRQWQRELTSKRNNEDYYELS
jgi:tetratricopeptide (TPR) repeat protein